ncbi:hypothetical protein KM043_001251 [Ampulex compressa]|nr:hypothetical protein KM043_001251 [Ampulex compressa]
MIANITILYGSETGTAQDVAEQIWKSAKRRGLCSTVCALDDYDVRNLALEKLVIFVVATTGQGDPPTNMRSFWRTMLRGKELLPIGLADDQHDLGIDAVVDSWVQQLWTKIANIYHVHIGADNNDETTIVERYNVYILDNENKNLSTECALINDIYAKDLTTEENLRVGMVVENTRTTVKDHFQDVRLIRIQSENITYEPGDVVYVRPKNAKNEVDKFFNLLHDNNVPLYPDTIVQVLKKEIRIPSVLEQTLTLGQIVEQYWDLNYKPRRSTMRILSVISEDNLEKEKLHEFSTAAGQEELYNYINRPRRNILEVFADFPHTTKKLNIKVLFEIMSPIKPRAFSIASSLRATKEDLHVLVAVVKYKTKLFEPRYGLCSTWLASLECADKIIFWIQKGTFKFTYDKPMIFIGPGTGVAPFRSVLLDKAALNQSLINCVLFFGCRNKEKDYHCRDDFEALSKDRGLKVYCAFSRDQEHKVYVQDVIREQKQLCWDFLQNGGTIYLAGSSKNMPNSVREEFVNIAAEFGDLNKEQAENFVKRMEMEIRYQSETWG